jgi:hypothetical protein
MIPQGTPQHYHAACRRHYIDNRHHIGGRHHPTPGLASGKPDDKLQRVIKYSRALDIS